MRFDADRAPFTPKLNPMAIELYTAATPLVTTGMDVFTAPFVNVPTFVNPLFTTGRTRLDVFLRLLKVDDRLFFVFILFAIIEYTYKIFAYIILY